MSKKTKTSKISIVETIVSTTKHDNHKRVNDVLLNASEPLTMKQIVAASGLDNTYYCYCNAMVQKGLFVKEAGKYAVAKDSKGKKLSPLELALQARAEKEATAKS